jgi:aspartyl-tRNA(Asn)/glutamyl-tRNA(Gln) amidotransferase subunit A
MHDMSIASQIQALKTREFSSLELTQHYLDRIKRLNPSLNALITVTEEKALDSAKKADRALNGDNNNELCGIQSCTKIFFVRKGLELVAVRKC